MPDDRMPVAILSADNIHNLENQIEEWIEKGYFFKSFHTSEDPYFYYAVMVIARAR